MCLAIPGKIIEKTTDENAIFSSGKVTFGGIVKEVNLSMVPEAGVGDYVLVHVGLAIGMVNEEEAKSTFAYIKKMGELEDLL